MKNGKYEMIVAPENYPGHKYRGRYAYEHLVVFWQNTSRLPGFGMAIKHKNGNRRDNRFSNLEEIVRSVKIAGKENPLVHGNGGYRRGCRCDVCKKGVTAAKTRWRRLFPKRALAESRRQQERRRKLKEAAQ